MFTITFWIEYHAWYEIILYSTLLLFIKLFFVTCSPSQRRILPSILIHAMALAELESNNTVGENCGKQWSSGKYWFDIFDNRWAKSSLVKYLFSSAYSSSNGCQPYEFHYVEISQFERFEFINGNSIDDFQSNSRSRYRFSTAIRRVNSHNNGYFPLPVFQTKILRSKLSRIQICWLRSHYGKNGKELWHIVPSFLSYYACAFNKLFSFSPCSRHETPN